MAKHLEDKVEKINSIIFAPFDADDMRYLIKEFFDADDVVISKISEDYLRYVQGELRELKRKFYIQISKGEKYDRLIDKYSK